MCEECDQERDGKRRRTNSMLCTPPRKKIRHTPTEKEDEKEREKENITFVPFFFIFSSYLIYYPPLVLNLPIYIHNDDELIHNTCDSSSLKC